MCMYIYNVLCIVWVWCVGSDLVCIPEKVACMTGVVVCGYMYAINNESQFLLYSLGNYVHASA